MDERNMVCTSQVVDMEIDRQAQDHLHPDPCYYLGNSGHYPHANMYRVLPTSGSTSNIDPRQFPNNHEHSVFYGGQYSGIQHHNPMNMDLGPTSGFHNPCIIPPPGSGVFPVPHVSSDQLSSSGHPGYVGFGLNEFVGNHHFVEGVRSSGKRKNAEVVPGNYHQVNAAATTTLGMPPLVSGLLQSDGQSESGASVPDTAASTPPDYLMNGMLPITAGRSTRSVRSRSNALGLPMEPPIMHSMNHLVQGNYVSQPFQQTTWVEQQYGNSVNEGSTSSWSYSPAIPYLNGGSVSGIPSDIPSMAGQGYSDTRNSSALLNPPMHHHPHQQHHFHPCPPAMQAIHVHNTYQIQPIMPSFRHPTGNSLQHGTMNHSLDDIDIGSRHTRTFPTNGLRVYRPHRNGPHQAVPAHINRPHLRYMSEEEVAILEFPGFYEVGSSTDRHRDMRLDIDDMSYEELLALGERIGNVVTGFPEETIASHLKTKLYHSTPTEGTNNETETCIVCQVEFKDAEKVGSLDCGHEYHVDCIKRWLQVKNVCPICKVPAINVEK